MNFSSKPTIRLVLAWLAVLCLGWTGSSAAGEAGGRNLPDFDCRAVSQSAAASPSKDRSAAISRIAGQASDVRVDWDLVSGSPSWVASRTGFLSGPSGVGRTISTQTISRIGSGDSNQVVKTFLDDHQDLFGYGSEILNSARVERDSVNARNGLRTVVWKQQVDRIPVFEGLIVAHLTRNEELVSISSHFVAAPGDAARTGTPSWTGLVTNPPVAAVEAVRLASQNIGETPGRDEISPVDAAASQSSPRQQFHGPKFTGVVDARLVWLPLDARTLRLCWQVVQISRRRGEMFEHLIDAQTGEVRLRRSLTEHAGTFSYLVFYADSPTPMSPGFFTPTNLQPPTISQVFVTTNAFDSTASPNGWINDGDTQTLGNNVDAGFDPFADGLADIPRPQSSNGVFDYPVDLTQPPATYTNSSVVNVFFWCNWMHDKLYELGFNEAAGNFQTDNFGRGGEAGDPIIALAQFGGAYTPAQAPNDFNADTFSTPPDGMPGYIRMSLYSGPTPYRDSDFDTQIILHEYTHGLSNRRVGGGVGISQQQSQGLGEGWSDFYSLALTTTNANAGANYPIGGYVAYQLFGQLTNNYYFGIRHYPYSTNLNVDPVTFKDIDPSQFSLHPGVPRSPVITNDATEVHNQGEVWCACLWDARANLVAAHGFPAGNQLMLQLVTDAMGLTPANPTFTQARDAIIQADIVDTGGSNNLALWTAFARRGLGWNAVAPSSSTTSGVVESYALPDPLLVFAPDGLNFAGTIGGLFVPTMAPIDLVDTVSSPINWAAVSGAPWLSISNASGVLAGGVSTNFGVLASAAAESLGLGSYTSSVTISNLATGFAQTQTVNLAVSAPPAYMFSLNADPGWTRQGEWAFGVPTGQGGAAAGGQGYPDPASGPTSSNVFGVNLNGNYSLTDNGGPYYLIVGPLNFSGTSNSTLLFERWLNTDAQPYAYATVDVSPDGVNWTSLFSNMNGPVADSAWTPQTFDISGVADGQPSVYVRWGYQINPGAFAYSGWNIANVDFLAISPLALTLPASATKGNGVLTNQGAVAIMQPLNYNLSVALVSDNTSKITVPPTVTIPAGQTNVFFSPAVVNNGLLDGTQVASVTASAAGYFNATDSITVFDNRSARLSFNLPASATEASGGFQGTILSSAAPAADISVSVFSSDTNRVQVPSVVTLPAGQTSAVFSATVVESGQLDGNETVTLTASVINWTNGVGSIMIIGNDADLAVNAPAKARASNGVITNGAAVTLAGVLPTNLVVSLSSSDASKLNVVASVTILAGQTSAPFNVSLVNTGQVYGTKPVTVTATAPGFTNGAAVVLVTDNFTVPPSINPNPPNLSSNNPTVLTLSWSPGPGEGLQQAANGGFETGDFTGWTDVTNSGGGFVIDNGTVVPPSGDPPVAPFEGNYYALAEQASLGIVELHQDVALPSGAGPVTLTWADRVRNFNPSFAADQEFRVEIRDLSDNVLAVPFETLPGSILLNGWMQRSVDLSGFAGQSVRIAFVADAEQFYLEVGLDDVSVSAGTPPPTKYDVYLGTNPNPGPAQLIGTTTNTILNVSNLASFTTYYWQVAAYRLPNKAEETFGPVWQFSALPGISISNTSLFRNHVMATNANFLVTLWPPSSQAVSVSYITSDGTAVAGTDYNQSAGTVTFNPGQTNAVISVPVDPVASVESNVWFFVNLASPVNALLANAQGMGSIFDNSPPVLAPINNQVVNEATPLVITNIASNPGQPGGTFIFSVDPGGPAWTIINPATGVFRWTPTEAEGPGAYFVTVRVTDNGSPTLTATQTFQVMVDAVPGAPQLSPIANQLMHAGATLAITNSATDSNGAPNTLTYSLDPGAPAGAAIGAASGILTWTPGDIWAGTTNMFTVRVSDTNQPPLSNVQSFIVAVLPRPAIAAVVSHGAVTLTWTAIAGNTYRVQYTSNFSGGWTNLPGQVTATGPAASETDSSPPPGVRFYRTQLISQ